jgi:ubiquinone/menaquinone biosynthesis C-methylase UbiE
MHDRVFKHTEAHKLEDPERLRWLPPAEVISQLCLSPGMKIADIGAGTGYFSIPMAQAVGVLGQVYAVDLQPEMLDLLREKLAQAQENGRGSISLLQGDASRLPLPEHAVQVAFYANIWHEIENHDAAFDEALRVSVPGGKIAILDWRDDCSPPPGPPRDHRISQEAVVAFLRTKGCRNVVSRNVGQFGYLVTAVINSPN